MAKRVEWIDTAKFICIFWVMLSHLESDTEFLYSFYSPFFLTVFFFLSGYVCKKENNFMVHICKKAKGLLLPWFIFSNLNIILSAIISFKGERNIPEEFLKNLLQIRGLGDGLWFVAALFIAYIPFYWVIQIKDKRISIGIAFCLSLISIIYSLKMPAQIFPWGSSALPWHLEYMFYAMFWMLLGFHFKGLAEGLFDKFNTIMNRIVAWIVYIFVLFLPILDGGYRQIVFGYIQSIIGIVAIIATCKAVTSNRLVLYVGQNTLIYFALHGKVYSLIQMGLRKIIPQQYLLILGNQLYSSLLAISITIVMTVVLIVPAFIINKWFPWTLGRTQKNKTQKYSRHMRI